MAVKNKITEEFLEGLEEAKSRLEVLQFREISFMEKGFANFVKYQRDKLSVEFMFGPSDWNVEIIIYTSIRKYEFKDLLAIPAISQWVHANLYKQENERNVKKELLWFVELLKISLSIIE